ncbi:MAG: hypothetical protein ACLQAH_09960 [Limisphaerales bacterium]
MKKLALFSIGILALALGSARADNTICYTTFEDWTSFVNGSGPQGGLTFTPVTTFDFDGVTVNGIGNGSNPGGAGTLGSLEISPIVPCGWGNGPGFGFGGITDAMLKAMDGPAAGYGNPQLAQSGTLLVDFTMPDNSLGGSSFTMGIFFQDDAQWGGWQANQLYDLGPVTTPSGTEEMYEAVIPYTLNADANDIWWTQIGLWLFTDYQGSNPWYIDSISVVPLPIIVSPPPGQSLFTTYEDFSPFTPAGGDLVSADNTWSVIVNTINGLGNTTAPGAGGTDGSLLVYWSSLETGWGDIADAPGENGNMGFMQAIAPGSTGANIAASYGNIYLDYSRPDNTDGGSYFQLGVLLQYQGNWSPFFWSSTTDLGVQDPFGNEVYEATIPYNIVGEPNNFFSFGVMVNSDYQPVNGFYIDEISVVAAQAPLITGISLNGTQLTITGVNGLASKFFSLISTTDLSKPKNQWTLVSTGNAFTGSPFSITTTINPANTPEFYSILVNN